MAATGQDKIKIGFGPMLQGFHYLPFNDPSAFSMLSKEDDIAAVMLETVQGEGESIPPIRNSSKPYRHFAKTNRRCLSQTRFKPESAGRARHSAMSISASLGHHHCCERAWKRFSRRSRDRQKKLGDAFTPGTHGTTFGGNKLAMAAVKATLDIVFQPDFLQAAADKGSFKSAAEP